MLKTDSDLQNSQNSKIYVVSDGCRSYPTLCEIKQEILDLEKQTMINLNELEEERKTNAREVSLLEMANTNNRHRLHKINETAHALIIALHKSQNIDSELKQRLEILLQNRHLKSLLSETNIAFYVDRITEQYEYRLCGIKRLIGNKKNPKTKQIHYNSLPFKIWQRARTHLSLALYLYSFLYMKKLVFKHKETWRSMSSNSSVKICL